MRVSRGLPRPASATRAGSSLAWLRHVVAIAQQRGGGGVRDTRAAGELPCSAVLLLGGGVNNLAHLAWLRHVVAIAQCSNAVEVESGTPARPASCRARRCSTARGRREQPRQVLPDGAD